MIKLNFRLKDHWDAMHKLIHQNKAIPMAAQGGDLLETTGMLIWHRIAEQQASDAIIDGLAFMHEGVGKQIMPRVKSFNKKDMDAEPDRWDEVDGLYYRCKDVSHSQAWYAWAGLIQNSTHSEIALETAGIIAGRIILDGYRLIWKKELGRAGDFFPIYPSNAWLRALTIGQYYKRSVPFRGYLGYWLLPVWTWVESKLKKKNGKPYYEHTDAFNTCMILYFMGKKKKLKAHMERWPDMRVMLSALYNGNSSTNPDVIQNDMKWYFLQEMEAYVA